MMDIVDKEYFLKNVKALYFYQKRGFDWHWDYTSETNNLSSDLKYIYKSDSGTETGPVYRIDVKV
jgi:hypothetical protein